MQYFQQDPGTLEIRIAQAEANLGEFESLLKSPEADCSASEAVELLKSMVSRLNGLYKEREASQLLRAD